MFIFIKTKTNGRQLVNTRYILSIQQKNGKTYMLVKGQDEASEVLEDFDLLTSRILSLYEK